jgi:hypothetical protein
MMIIPVVYFVISVVPTIALAELGIRGSVSIFILGLYYKSSGTFTDEISMGILAASSVLWLINLILPALIGTIFVFNLKFFRK